MKYLILDDLNSFECIGAKCSYTCCKDWTIDIDSTSANFYRNVKGEFGEKLKNGITDKDGNSYFQLNEGCCPFLNEDSLCDIYIHLGADHLCDTCKVYPRRNWVYGDLTFVGKAISCPEVARILFESAAPLPFGFSEDVSVSNEDVDWTVFNLYVKGMTTSIEILQNHELDFTVRMRAVLLFNYYFEKYLNSDNDCTELFDMFSSTDSILVLTEKVNHLNTNYNSRITLFVQITKNISQIVNNKPIMRYLSLGTHLLQKQKDKNIEQFWAFKNCTEDKIDLDHIHEQYGVYYISMYYMDFYKKKQPYKFIVQFFALFYLQNCFETFVYNKNMENLALNDLIEIYTKTARTYEHSFENKNMETTFSVLEKNEMTSLAFLMSLV